MSLTPTNPEATTPEPTQPTTEASPAPAAPAPPAPQTRHTPAWVKAIRPHPPVSVVILTLNEEINIRAAIDSCEWCDDVHVLDSGSTDRTQEIAREMGAQVHYHAFTSFGEQRNWAIDNIPTKHPWIFHLDADERFTAKLVDAMTDRLSSDVEEAGFHIPSKTMFMGRWLKRSAGYPTYQMRLFHKERMRFIDYGHGQREDEAAKTGVIEVPYLHFSFSKGIYDWLEKHNRYSTLEALQVIQGTEYEWKIKDLFFARKIKRWRAWKELVYHMPFRAKLRWFGILFFNGGILEGRAAIAYANLMAMYENMITTKLRVLRSQIEMGAEYLPPSLREPSQQFEPMDTPQARAKIDPNRPLLFRANQSHAHSPADIGEDDPALTVDNFLQQRVGPMVDTSKRILITGGSGFIGSNLVDLYDQLGVEVLNISNVPPRDKEQNKQWLKTDLNDADATHRAIHDFDPHIVYHLAARTDLDETNRIDGYNVNIKGVKNVLKATETLGNIERIVVTSSQLVCVPGYVPRYEDEYKPHTLYGKSKVETERITRSWANAPCPWTITRPTSIWGPWFDIPYRTFFETIARGRYYHQRGADPLRSFGFVGNIVQQYVALAQADPQLVDRRTFYMSDYQPTRVYDWANLVQQTMGVKPLREIPMSALKVAARLGDAAQMVGIKRAPITSFRLKNLTSNNYISMADVEEVVGPPLYNIAEGTRLTVDWMRDHKLIKPTRD